MAAMTVKVGSTTLDEAHEVSYSDTLNDVGSGSMTLAHDDPDIATASLDIGSTVEVQVNGTRIGRWIVETKRRSRIVSPESDTGYIYTGRTMLAELERSIVYPVRPPRSVTLPIFTGYLSPKPFAGVDRHFGPMDPDYDVSGWGSAAEVAPTTGALSPIGWNDPDASWIGGDHDYHWAVKTFTTNADFSVGVRFACTDAMEVWLDGVLLGRLDPVVDEDTASKTRRVIVEVTDGDHTIAVRTQRLSSDNCLSLVTVWGRNTETNYARTDDTWKLLADTPAGYTPHEIIDILLAEAQGRDELDGWTLTSSSSSDTDSTAWDRLPDDFALRVGDTLLDVLRQMSEAWIDFGVRPADGARQLSMWVAGDRGAASGVTWAEGSTILEGRYDTSDAELRNRVLIVWGDGIIRGQIDGSITEHGARSTLLNLGQVADGPTALDVALATIDPMSDVEESVTLVVAPETGDVPGVDVIVGDTVTAPNISGTPATYRMVACSWAQDGDEVTFAPELASSRDIAEQRWQRWLTRTNHGTINGRSRSATVSSPSIKVNMQVVDAIVRTFSLSGSTVPELDDESSAIAADRRMRLVKIVALATAAGTGNTTAEMLKNGAGTGDEVTMGNAVVDATEYFSAGATWEFADTVAVKISAANGHQGCSYECHFVEPGG